MAVDADDILQIVFLKIHQKLGTLRNEQRLESWFFQIARHAVIDHLRKPQSNDFGIDEVTVEATDDTTAEVSRCISALVDVLPTDQKRAVSLYELEGLSQATIAEQESISLSAAKSRIQRGRKKLESMLKDCCRFQFDARGNVLEYQCKENACESNCDCQE